MFSTRRLCACGYIIQLQFGCCWVLLRGVQARANNRVDVGSPSRWVRHWTCARRSTKRQSPQPTNFNLLYRLQASAKGLKMPASLQSDDRNELLYREIDSFVWLNYSVRISLKLKPKLYLPWRFDLTEIFIRRSWFSILPRLYATIDCRVKKVVIGVTESRPDSWLVDLCPGQFISRGIIWPRRPYAIIYPGYNIAQAALTPDIVWCRVYCGLLHQ